MDQNLTRINELSKDIMKLKQQANSRQNKSKSELKEVEKLKTNIHHNLISGVLTLEQQMKETELRLSKLRIRMNNFWLKKEEMANQTEFNKIKIQSTLDAYKKEREKLFGLDE